MRFFPRECTGDATADVGTDVIAEGGEIQARMTQLTGQRTVPMVFIGGKLIGGGSDVAAAAAKGHLDDLLRSAGAVLERE